jgi:hypothetical protein
MRTSERRRLKLTMTPVIRCHARACRGHLPLERRADGRSEHIRYSQPRAVGAQVVRFGPRTASSRFNSLIAPATDWDEFAFSVRRRRTRTAGSLSLRPFQGHRLVSDIVDKFGLAPLPIPGPELIDRSSKVCGFDSAWVLTCLLDRSPKPDKLRRTFKLRQRPPGGLLRVNNGGN